MCCWLQKMRVLACVCHICFFKFLSASAVASESMLAFVGTCEGLLLLGCSTTCCLQSCQAPSSASMPLAVDTVVEGARSQFKTWDHWDGPRTYWFVTLPPSGLLTCCGLLVSVLAHRLYLLLCCFPTNTIPLHFFGQDGKSGRPWKIS